MFNLKNLMVSKHKFISYNIFSKEIFEKKVILEIQGLCITAWSIGAMLSLHMSRFKHRGTKPQVTIQLQAA